MMKSLDTETTGLDPYHGSCPYFVTMGDENSDQSFWEWDMDPFTRTPDIPVEDLEEIQAEIDEADRLVLQNSIYDFKILSTIEEIVDGWKWDDWPWEKIHDTTYSGHLLASCQARDLTTQSLIYLGINTKPLEDDIKEATEKARRICRSKRFIEEHGKWALSEKGRPDMPSAGKEPWKGDMWLPRTVCRLAPDFLPDWYGWKGPTKKYEGDNPEEHPWWTLLEEYANADSEVTLPIHKKHEKLMRKKGVWKIYLEKLKQQGIVYEMQEVGISVNSKKKAELYDQYTKETQQYRHLCTGLADHENLKDLPVNGRSKALDEVVFGKFGLKSHKTSKKTGAPSMDKDVLKEWMDTLPRRSKARHFIEALMEYRKRKTAMTFLDGYERFWKATSHKDWYILHPNLNVTGTNTLRYTSNNPNEQNVSAKEGFNLRYCFGPRPGRCWASLDYENLELRIPAYEAGEQELIDLFERPNEPPYYGSEHILNFSTVYPDKWQEAIKRSSLDDAARFIKTQWKSSWYSDCKRGDFAVQFGSVDRGPDQWSTADLAFGRKGSQRLLNERFAKKDKLNKRCIEEANATGYVETIPDAEISPNKGYPLQCSRTKYNRISPTIPLSYHVQGTACWIIMRAMIKIKEYLDNEVNVGKEPEDMWHIIIQVHDELVIDFPFKNGLDEYTRSVLMEIRELMISCGEPVGVPLGVGCEIHQENWSKGEDLK